jgi:hypothetical protein
VRWKNLQLELAPVPSCEKIREAFSDFLGLSKPGASIMPFDFRRGESRFTADPTMRHGGAVVLCALLLLFCVNARLAHYDIHQRTNKLATAQTYLDGVETSRKLAVGAVLLLFCAGVFTFLASTIGRRVLLAVVAEPPVPFSGFDPESHLRPPPRR